MRIGLIVLPVTLALLAPSVGLAQPPPAAQDLALRINLDDRVRVEDMSGLKTTGHLTRLTVEDIVLQTDSGEKRFALDTVRKVSVRGYALGKGALIGAVVGAVLGAVANCTHEGGGGCFIAGAFAAAPIGAGVGLAVNALVPRMKTVYPAATGGVAAGPLDDLALRVNLDDPLEVVDRSGARTVGRLSRLTLDEITITTPDGEKHLPRSEVGQVAVRHSHRRAAVLIGAAAGAATGAALACTGPDRTECADGAIIVGALGAGVGLAVGELFRHSTIVFPGPKTRASLSPLASPGIIGVRASLRW